MDIKHIAQQALSLSDLAAGREVVTSDELVKLPTISICGIDPVEVPDSDGELRKTYIVICTELPKNYFYANTLLIKIFDKCIEYAEGDISAVNDVLEHSPLEVKMVMSKTKKGMPIMKVELL